jgi:hypothetical protein
MAKVSIKAPTIVSKPIVQVFAPFLPRIPTSLTLEARRSLCKSCYFVNLHVLIHQIQIPLFLHPLELGQAGGVGPLMPLRALKTLRGAPLSVASVLFSAVSDSSTYKTSASEHAVAQPWLTSGF